MADNQVPKRSSSVGTTDAPQPDFQTTRHHRTDGSRESLTPAQLHALFDILTHHETYAEVESFKDPKTITEYGYPFTLNSAVDDPNERNKSGSSAPLLASFLRGVVLPLPGVKDLPADFWNVKNRGIIAKLAEAELSESYDKGALGTRKTLATVSSVVHENVSRGILGGFPAGVKRDLHSDYDTTKAEDLARAWDDGVHELVYGDLIDELFDCIIKNDNLECHSPAVRAASDYVHIHLGTFLHYVFVLSPEGQYLLKLVENLHQLIPYSMIKQTLRIGNAATMINGMIKLLLAKMSVGAISNWIGLTSGADDGVNLLQRIITLVLSWDSAEFRKSVDRVEKAKDGPLREHLAAIKQHIQSTREDHDAVRTRSQEKGESIVASILQKHRPDLLPSLSESDHTQLLDYYSAILSVRDREEITRVLCRQSPDLFTQALRDGVAAFDPIIRTIHQNVDIREHLSAMETFLNDFIKTSRPSKDSSSRSKKTDSVPQPPSVEDYVRLLQRNESLLYNWLHEFTANCPEVRESFRTWAKDVIRTFRQEQVSARTESGNPKADDATSNPELRQSAAGAMSSALQGLYAGLPAHTQQEVLSTLDSYATYLTDLERLSTSRLQTVIDNLANSEPPSKSGANTPKRTGVSAPTSGVSTPTKAASMAGPGMYLSRWQALLNQTVVTPASVKGPLRSGKDIKGNTTMGKTGSEGSKDAWDSGFLALQAEKDVPAPPNVDPALEAFLPGFRRILADQDGKAK